MQPSAQKHEQLSKEDLTNMFVRLQTIKKAEILCGVQIPREKTIQMSGQQFLEQAESVFKELYPLYKLAYDWN